MKNFYDDNQKKGAAFEATPAKPLNAHNTSKNNQHKICLLALADSPKSTIDLRHVYGIMQPAPRIKELRDMGYKIDTVRIDGYTPDNIKHHAVAKYVLTQLQPIVSEVV